MAAGSSHVPGPGLPPPPTEVHTPWASPTGPAAAAAYQLFVLLSRMTRVLPSPARALRAAASAGAIGAGGAGAGLGGTAATGGGSLGLLSAEAVAQQELLLGCGAALMRDVIGPVVVQKHVQVRDRVGKTSGGTMPRKLGEYDTRVRVVARVRSGARRS